MTKRVAVVAVALLLAQGRGVEGNTFDAGAPTVDVLKEARDQAAEQPGVTQTREVTPPASPAAPGVEITVDVPIRDAYQTFWESPKRWGGLGPYIPVTVLPGTLVTLPFKSRVAVPYPGYKIKHEVVPSVLNISFATAAEAYAVCGNDQQMLKLNNQTKVRPSTNQTKAWPPTICLPQMFKHLKIQAGFRTPSSYVTPVGYVHVDFTLIVRRPSSRVDVRPMPDKGALANAGVKIKVDVEVDTVHGYNTSRDRDLDMEDQRQMDMTPNEVVILRFKSTRFYFKSPHSYGPRMSETVPSAVSVSVAPAAEASSVCGSDQQMLKLKNELAGTGTVSPSTLCLPRGFRRQEIAACLYTVRDDGEVLPINFKLTITPR